MPEIVNTSVLALSDNTSSEEDNRDTMIKVDNVSMVFNMASEQLNSLKEYFIQIARGKLFFKGFTALDGISFEVKRGDVFGIIGTNGSGKSTLLKIIAGVLEPTEGTCEINGNIAPLIELGAGFDTELSARENIYLNGALLGYSRAFIDSHFDEIVEFAEVEKFLDMPLKNYSSGMISRIAFAIATVIVPEILIVDEVLSVGDFMFQKKCEDRIKDLIERHGVTVLIVSHSNDQVARLCNKTIWIEKGHTRLMGKASTVCQIYEALGGRTGQSASEQRIFNALSKASEDNDNALRSCERTDITGDNFFSIAAKAMLRTWKNKTVETVILAASGTHANTIAAMGYAGMLDAPILPTKAEDIPDAIESAIIMLKPSRIVVFDCAQNSTGLANRIADIDSNIRVSFFVNDNPTNLCCEIISNAATEGAWGRSAIIVDCDENAESFAASPVSFSQAWPFVITRGHQIENPSLLARTFKEAGITSAYVIGPLTLSDSVDELERLGISIERIHEETSPLTCVKLCKWVQSSDGFGSSTLCIASRAAGQWPDTLASGPLCAKMNAALLLEEPTDLDSIAQCLDFVSDTKPQRVLFLGNETGLSPLDRKMIISEIARRQL